MPKTKLNLDKLISRTKIYLVVIAIILVILCVVEPKAIIPSILAYIAIFVYTIWSNNKRKTEISEHINELTVSVDKAAQSTIINSPFPLVVLETNGNIIWKSSNFIKEFANIDTGTTLTDVIKELKLKIENGKNTNNISISESMKIGDKNYKVIAEYTKLREKELKNEDGTKIINKLKLSVLISFTVYIVLMYFSLITGTSSYTYSEVQIGYKGWFESGNSIGTIMLLEMFIILPNLGKNNKTGIRIWTFMTIVLAGAYLCTLLGTRTGLFGFIIVILMYCIICIINSLIKNSKLNKKALPAFLLALVVIGIAVIAFGSKTIERRKDLQERENQIIDTMTGKTAHVTGDIVDIVKKIKNNEIDEGYMPESMQKTYLELYDIANEKQIQNTNMRALQFIYHSRLIKNQDSIPMLLFGNGYMVHFYEMIFEMEVPAFLYNFGVIGFFLYFMPFLAIAMYGTYMAVKKIKNMNIEFMMSTLGLWFAIFISFLSGYTFFNSSSMMIIIVLVTLIFNGCKDLEDDEMKIYEIKK